MSVPEQMPLLRVEKALGKILESIIFSDKKMNKEGFDELQNEIAEMILGKNIYDLGQVKEKISRIKEEVKEENLSYDVYQEILAAISISMIESIKHLISCAMNYLTQAQ
ncbi:MAG: hypothetical protein ACFE68_05265 [Candidatus Hodarchaeota archaeon]